MCSINIMITKVMNTDEQGIASVLMLIICAQFLTQPGKKTESKFELKSHYVYLSCCVFQPAFESFLHPKAGQLFCHFQPYFGCSLVIFHPKKKNI